MIFWGNYNHILSHEIYFLAFILHKPQQDKVTYTKETSNIGLTCVQLSSLCFLIFLYEIKIKWIKNSKIFSVMVLNTYKSNEYIDVTKWQLSLLCKCPNVWFQERVNLICRRHRLLSFLLQWRASVPVVCPWPLVSLPTMPLCSLPSRYFPRSLKQEVTIRKCKTQQNKRLPNDLEERPKPSSEWTLSYLVHILL